LWLYHYVSSLYFRWRTVSEVDKEYTFIIAKNIHQNILLPEDNTQSFLKKIQDEFWNQKLIDDNPNLLNVTDKTTKILCKEMEKYFKKQKIDVKIGYILKDD
jgi:Fe-S cluster biosynthesis and repair protein YggX